MLELRREQKSNKGPIQGIAAGSQSEAGIEVFPGHDSVKKFSHGHHHAMGEPKLIKPDDRSHISAKTLEYSNHRNKLLSQVREKSDSKNTLLTANS